MLIFLAHGNVHSPKEALTEAFLKTDVAFREELAFQNNAKRILQKNWHPGCTAVIALLVRDILFVGNAGDCRAILCRNGRPFPLTKVTITFNGLVNILDRLGSLG